MLVAEVDYHLHVRQRLEEALDTWSVEDVDAAITACMGPEFPDRFPRKERDSSGGRFPEHVISTCLSAMDRLRQRSADCAPALARGAVEVDERRKILTISTPIKFARRAPPDTSAELEDSDKKDSVSSIKDLATALKTYMARIIIEGHTGASNRADYWSALAKNRAELICSILLKERRGSDKGGTCKASRAGEQKS